MWLTHMEYMETKTVQLCPQSESLSPLRGLKPALSKQFPSKQAGGGSLLPAFATQPHSGGPHVMNQLTQLNKQYIGGIWRYGKSSKVLTDKNPYNGNSIADFKLANLTDLD